MAAAAQAKKRAAKNDHAKSDRARESIIPRSELLLLKGEDAEQYRRNCDREHLAFLMAATIRLCHEYEDRHGDVDKVIFDDLAAVRWVLANAIGSIDGHTVGGDLRHVRTDTVANDLRVIANLMDTITSARRVADGQQ
jgi:hypothetical protein